MILKRIIVTGNWTIQDLCIHPSGLSYNGRTFNVSIPLAKERHHFLLLVSFFVTFFRFVLTLHLRGLCGKMIFHTLFSCVQTLHVYRGRFSCRYLTSTGKFRCIYVPCSHFRGNLENKTDSSIFFRTTRGSKFGTTKCRKPIFRNFKIANIKI